MLFFQSEMTQNPDKIEKDKATLVYRTLANTGTAHMLLFVNYVLQKVDSLNREFQAVKSKIYKVFNSVRSQYRSIMSQFIKTDILESLDIAEIDPTDPSIYTAVKEIFLGGKCESKIIDEPLGENENRFRSDCRAFLIEVCVQIRNRFDLSKGSVLDLLSAIEPKSLLDHGNNLKSLVPLASRFPNIVDDLDALDDQWRELVWNKEILGPLMNLSPEAFWPAVGAIENAASEKKFELLSNFMLAMLSLPHSTAAVERIFSLVNGLKTKDTNRLYTSTLMNRLLARQHVTRKGSNCTTWQPEKSLIDDVKDGICHQRYQERLRLHHLSEEMTIYDVYDE